MKHVSILIPPGGVLASIELPRQVFTEANDYLVSQGRYPLFDIHLVGVSNSVELNNGLFTVQADTTIDKLRKTDLIIIPGIHRDVDEHLANSHGLMEWIRKQYDNGAEVASLCVGAFLLAGTGLLNGRQCATHWKAAPHFKHLYPTVKLLTDKIITDENGIYSSGGGISYLNLIVYLLEKYGDRDLALYCSKFFQVDISRHNQSLFSIFQGQKNHGDTTVQKAQEFIEANFQEKITVDHLADTLATGRRSLERRFKKATNNTLYEYIQRVKIEAAKKKLETTNKKITEIVAEVGYADYKTFRLSFKSLTGVLPNEYRSKYNRGDL